jgi:hypothetical protein
LPRGKGKKENRNYASQQVGKTESTASLEVCKKKAKRHAQNFEVLNMSLPWGQNFPSRFARA